MSGLSTHSPHSGGTKGLDRGHQENREHPEQQGPGRGSRLPPNGNWRRAAAVAFCAGILALVAGCSAGSTVANDTTGSGQPLAARTAITLAADQTQRVNSMAATFAVQISGKVDETVTGTMQMRLRPALLADASLNVSAAGQKFPLDEIVTAQAFYLKSPAFAALAKPGRPWVEIRLSKLSGNLGSSLGSLLQNVQNGDPASQTRVLSASKNVHAVGTQVIDGVSTTHYAGTVKASAALATLSPSLRKQLAPTLKLITGDIRFNAWIDAQHVARRITESYTVMGETANVALNVTAVNQPVHISRPRASRTTVPPASVFGV